MAHGMFGKEIHECTLIFLGHVDMSGEGISMRPIGDQMGELFASSSNHLYIEPCADIMGEHRDILS